MCGGLHRAEETPRSFNNNNTIKLRIHVDGSNCMYIKWTEVEEEDAKGPTFITRLDIIECASECLWVRYWMLVGE